MATFVLSVTENEIYIYVESRGNIIGSKSWKNK